eukprot:TRINITY_DN80186_c0_g1_i1.p1 TRINITY_DN80186_c0_g1~~TRINITY_DN80186_c0_g1_i1.p1  ORF type:complete len:166 (+),score=28.45 TRINITY_DN80186_c0_g1_i1:97-594(+)
MELLSFVSPSAQSSARLNQAPEDFAHQSSVRQQVAIESATPVQGFCTSAGTTAIVGAVAAAAVRRVRRQQRRRGYIVKHPSMTLYAVGSNEAAAKAMSEGRMITVEESTIRQALGALFAVLFLWQGTLVSTTGAATMAIGGSSYTTLALLASNAVGFGASGFLSL